MDALKLVWREACAPLYHCRCSICERAILKANIAAGTVVPSQTTTAVEKPAPPAAQHPPENKPIMIHFKNPGARPQATTAEEEEEDEDDSLLDSDDSFADDDGSDDLVQYVATQRRIENDSLQPGKIVYPVTPRKRPSQELDPDDEKSEQWDAAKASKGRQKSTYSSDCDNEDADASPGEAAAGVAYAPEPDPDAVGCGDEEGEGYVAVTPDAVVECPRWWRWERMKRTSYESSPRIGMEMGEEDEGGEGRGRRDQEQTSTPEQR
ncbi:hypothetical protein EUX98_g6355 [Antrodiella citrinella]|uniref:Uncharacterized protein n=1 Tax=Antrodiella citrinella TaxID=2447956 RepID=A0A4S4MP62_9APHY|nr:hypothetical protein EUX98_g6355 [Antrodiella citrinella]